METHAGWDMLAQYLAVVRMGRVVRRSLFGILLFVEREIEVYVKNGIVDH